MMIKYKNREENNLTVKYEKRTVTKFEYCKIYPLHWVIHKLLCMNMPLEKLYYWRPTDRIIQIVITCKVLTYMYIG